MISSSVIEGRKDGYILRTGALSCVLHGGDDDDDGGGKA